LRDLGIQVIQAARDFLRQRLVIGWCTAYSGQNVRILQPQPVVDTLRCRDIREPSTVKCRHQKVTGAVAREGTAGAIRAVRGRSEPHEQ